MTPAPTTKNPPWHFRQFERTGGGDDVLLVDRHARQRCDIGTSRDDDGFCLDRLLAGVCGRHLDLPRRDDRAGADEGIDLVLFQQEGDTVHIGRDGIALVLHHRLEVERRLADDDAEGGQVMLRLGKFLRGREQGLRGDAADVEAGAAEGLVLFDNGDLEAQLRGADGADIAARPGSDDDEIVRHECAFYVIVPS